MGSTTIRRLERSDVRDRFESGALVCDRYLREFAWQNQERHSLGVTYVAAEEDSGVVIGYLTVAAAELQADVRDSAEVPRAFAGRVPVLRLGCHAVDRRFQGRRLGAELLVHALRLALAQSRSVGCAGMVVDAFPDAVPFYEHHGFMRLEAREGSSAIRPATVPMFLAVARIRRALALHE